MTKVNKVAGIIGGGVIGGGWAARFLLHGWDVRIYDPDPDAMRKIEEVLLNARRSLPSLYDERLPEEGQLQYCSSIAEAVTNATWIQESVPERLDAKHAAIQEIQAAASADTIVASSTSGFKPSELARISANPKQVLVAHPYNPVYLLPLVELVPHPNSDPNIVRSAQAVTTSIGMKPIVINKEIDAHIGDRLLEAVWREALWLIKDNYATTEEIDDIIRYSFGIRWAQMGLFETYRVAGGEAGMKHFISQFAPALQWPWSRLTDVPELDEALTEKIANQSDQQSGQHSIRELERQRDNNLVAMMRALKGQNWAVGELLNQHDLDLADTTSVDWSKPVRTVRRVVPLTWIDYNGHMNESHYLEVISQACDRIMALVRCDEDYIKSGHSYFTLENIINHIDEATAGEQVQVMTRIIESTGKKLHLYHELLTEDERLLATAEQLLIHVSLQTRKATEPVEPLASTLEQAAANQITLSRPEGLKAGRSEDTH